MARRSKAREIALQMLFQVDLNPDVDGRTVRAMIADRLGDEDLQQFAWVLFAGVMEFRPQLDEQIQAVATNWKLSRMAGTDRNCLRLGTFELLHTDTPHRVVIDEALELARKFGSDQSAQFVNGVLDKLVPAVKRAANGAAADEAVP
jgi:N utilization substance protein B